MLGLGYYILKGREIVPTNAKEWAEWFETADRHVRNNSKGSIQVSTVFLGLDHNYSQKGPPILFETMIFGGKYDQEMRRYATWEEAEEGHKEMCELVFSDFEDWGNIANWDKEIESVTAKKREVE